MKKIVIFSLMLSLTNVQASCPYPDWWQEQQCFMDQEQAAQSPITPRLLGFFISSMLGLAAYAIYKAETTPAVYQPSQENIVSPASSGSTTMRRKQRTFRSQQELKNEAHRLLGIPPKKKSEYGDPDVDANTTLNMIRAQTLPTDRPGAQRVSKAGKKDQKLKFSDTKETRNFPENCTTPTPGRSGAPKPNSPEITTTTEPL